MWSVFVDVVTSIHSMTTYPITTIFILARYGEILLRLPELSRISGLMKEELIQWMPANNTSCGLLYELLKGENMKDIS